MSNFESFRSLKKLAKAAPAILALTGSCTTVDQNLNTKNPHDKDMSTVVESIGEVAKKITDECKAVMKDPKAILEITEDDGKFGTGGVASVEKDGVRTRCAFGGGYY